MGVTVFQYNFTYKNRKWVRFGPYTIAYWPPALDDHYWELLKIREKVVHISFISAIFGDLYFFVLI